MTDPEQPRSWLRSVEELMNRLRRVEEYVQDLARRQGDGGNGGDGNGAAGEDGGDEQPDEPGPT